MSNTTTLPAVKIDRRQFLATTGGFLLAFTLEGGNKAANAAGAAPTVNAWVKISTDESITILIGGSELGQGAYSGLAQVAAEELMVDWAQVRAEPAPAAQSWVTGGSSNIRAHAQPLRVASAAAREMLIAAGAATWNVPPSTCIARQGKVINTITNDSLTFGSLATLAASMPVPANPPLVPASEYRLVGTPVKRTDIPAKTNGSAIYGIDVTVPGMLFAAVKHCPSVGGTVKSVRTATGSRAVVNLGNAIAAVSTTTEAARSAVSNVPVIWNIPSSAAGVDTALYITQAKQMMVNGPALVAEQQGDVTTAFQTAAKTLEMTYTLPYLAHACMEVLCCTVSVSPTGCDVWAPTQAPGWVLGTVMALTNMPASSINVHPTLMGGGLGRKIEQDYIAQAVKVAMAAGKPVKLTWSREEDMANDQYRPFALARVRVALDAQGNIKGWANRIVSPSILFQRGWIPGNVVDTQSTEGGTGLAYNFGSRLTEYVRHPGTVPVGFWRSVGHSINAFVVESAIDEVALATNTDPLMLRQRLLANDPRSLNVLNEAAKLGGWGTSLPAGHARGIAFAASFNSIVAEVAEVSHPAAGTIRVHKVAVAIDCGSAINPDSVEAQMQGGIFHGLSAALWGEVKFTNGVASARNFSNYRVLLMREAPVVSVKIIQSGAPIGGVGEPGVPPIAPAVANAYAKLTRTRVRTLPFFPGSGMSDG